MRLKKNKEALYPIRPIKDLKDLIESSARVFPERNAFLKKEKPGGTYMPVKYKEFKVQLDALGTAFMELGLKGERIAVIGENRFEWLLTYLSVVNGIGVIVPLDKELPSNEIRYLLEKSKARALIYSDKLESVVDNAVEGLEHLKYLISMDALEDSAQKLSLKKMIIKGHEYIHNGKTEYINAEIDPEAVGILLFTSGTTGLAKGVMLSHKNICANVMAMSQYVDAKETDVILSVLPMHHTYECTCGIFTPLYKGACIAFCEGLKHIVKNLNESKASVMLGVPLIFESMYTRLWRKVEKEGKTSKLRKGLAVNRALRKVGIDKSRKLFKSVHDALGGNIRMFISGAAAADPEILECFNDMGIIMFQGYGLTECSPIVSVNKDNNIKYNSVGLPLPGTELQIFEPDEEGIGEIICRSDSVMIGYYNNEEDTRKVIKEGWFYTGDYGYLDEEGFLYITGRKKNVIVTKNGKNIFPEEVEYYLNKSEYIKECMVWGKNDERREDTLVYADIVIDRDFLKETDRFYSDEEIHKLIQEVVHEVNSKIPLYKRIKRFNIRNDEFEKTTTQKIKRYGENIKNR